MQFNNKNAVIYGQYYYIYMLATSIWWPHNSSTIGYTDIINRFNVVQFLKIHYAYATSIEMYTVSIISTWGHSFVIHPVSLQHVFTAFGNFFNIQAKQI